MGGIERKPIGLVNGRPVYEGQPILVRDTSRHQVSEEFDRDESLRRLCLNRVVGRGSRSEIPQRVSFIGGDEMEQPPRYAALGLRSLRSRSFGDRPILPVTPLPGPLYERSISDEPAWAHRTMANWPILYGKHFLSLTDFDDFAIGRYGSTPPIDRAVDELVERRVPLDICRPQLEANLSSVARMILDALRSKLGPRFLGTGDPQLLRERNGLYYSAVSTIARRAACFTALCGEEMEREYGSDGRRIFEGWQSAIPERRGLQNVLLRSTLPMEPTVANIPPTREEMEATERRDPRLADRMVELSEIPEHLPMIDAAESLIPDGAFAGVHAVCVQHVLGSQIAMFDAMKRKGLDPSRVEIIGVPYSTSYVAQHALRRRGFTVDTPDIVDPNQVGPAVEKAVVAALQRAIVKSRADGKPILVLDDGGKASRAIHSFFPEDAHRFRLVEQTTRGITELEDLPEVVIRAVDVARSWMKKHESLKIGDEIARNIDLLLARISMPALEGKAVGVIGFGMIGSGTALRMRERNARVMVWDIDPAKRALAESMGFEVARSREELLAGKHVIVGCTGHRVITRDDIRHLDHETVLASASSRDVELDLSANRDPSVEVVPLLAEGPGDTRFTTRVWRFADKDIVVLRNGFPVNFNGALETSSFESIQQTRAIMLLGAAQAVSGTDVGIEPLSLATQHNLAQLCGLPIPSGV